jgi:hypothetical protein
LREVELRNEPDEMVDGTPGIPGDLPRRTDGRDRLGCDERCACDQPTASEDPHLSHSLTAPDGECESRADDDALDERPADPHVVNDLSRGHEL